jgi:steroid 5-alpha reductase family enzyme
MGLLPLLIGVAVSFVINTIGWAVSSAAETDLFYDLLGAAAHIATILFSWLASDYKDVRNVVASALVTVWASRLGIFLFTRAVSNGGDRRLDKYKHDPVKFSVLWFMQFLWVVFNTLPLLSINGWSNGSPMGITDFVGIVIFFAGFFIEVIADEQKRKFAVNKLNRGKFIDTGKYTARLE